MRPLASLILLLVITSVGATRADAQDAPPRVGPFVIDLHGIIPLFPSDSDQLATSRGLNVTELPGRGYGGQIGIHVYFLHWKALTVGVGGEAILARSTAR